MKGVEIGAFEHTVVDGSRRVLFYTICRDKKSKCFSVMTFVDGSVKL